MLLVLVLGAMLWALSQPRWLLNLATLVQPGALFFTQPTQPLIALTIDDAPTPHTTDQLLSVLQKHQVKATFFIITDQVPGLETTLQHILDQGHEIGNHMTTDEASIRLSPQVFETKLRQADQVLRPYSPLQWLRPGVGWYNATMVNIAHKHHYQLVLGSVFPYDTHIPSAWFAQTFILRKAQPGDIIVLHDGLGRGERTAQVLDRVLPVLKQRGFQFVTLSDLTCGLACGMVRSNHSTSQ
jgi:peptidoglycan-N-acetylglucosamine deacetylase